jgi:hypothetical protein
MMQLARRTSTDGLVQGRPNADPQADPLPHQSLTQAERIRTMEIEGLQEQHKLPIKHAGASWPLAVFAVAIASTLLTFYSTTPSRYYTYDSIALLIPNRDINIDHFGYQMFLRCLVKLEETSGLGSSCGYHSLQLVQSGLIGFGFSIFFLSILSPEQGRSQSMGREMTVAGAVTLLAGFSGASIRFVTILEDYVLSSLMIIAGMASWRWLREGSTLRHVVPTLLWCAAMSFDLTTMLVCAPLALYVAWHAIARHQWRNASLTVFMNAAFLALSLVLLLTHRGQYSHPSWGGYTLDLSSVKAFIVGAGRMYVYLVEPSMEMLSTGAGKTLLATALFLGGLLSLQLAVGLIRRPGCLDAIARAALVGIGCRVTFLFWFLPGNSEFMILPFLMLLSISARNLVQGGAATKRWLTITSVTAALVISLANMILVGVPAHRQPPTPYLEAMKQVASDVHLPVNAHLALLCEDEYFSVSYNARSVLLSRADIDAFPRVDVFTFAPKAAPLTSVGEAEAWVGQRLARLLDQVSTHRYAAMISSEKGGEFRGVADLIESSNHRIATDLPTYLKSLQLPRLVESRIPITAGRKVGQYRIWHVTTGAKHFGRSTFTSRLRSEGPEPGP